MEKIKNHRVLKGIFAAALSCISTVSFASVINRVVIEESLLKMQHEVAVIFIVAGSSFLLTAIFFGILSRRFQKLDIFIYSCGAFLSVLGFFVMTKK